MQLKTTNLRHTVLPGGLLTGIFPIQATCKDKCETRHCKATHERRVKCFTLASTNHLEDTSPNLSLNHVDHPLCLTIVSILLADRRKGEISEVIKHIGVEASRIN
jgi:hypothetical protein